MADSGETLNTHVPDLKTRATLSYAEAKRASERLQQALHTYDGRGITETSPSTWSAHRRCVDKFLRSQATEWALALVILINLVLVIAETDTLAKHERLPLWLKASNYTLSVVYVIELGLRIYVHCLAFFKDPWHIMDFTIVATDLGAEMLSLVLQNMPSISVLRVFRLARLARAVKVLIMFPELYVMVRGMWGALRTIFWGTLLLSMALVIWGILAVQIIHPINREVTKTLVYESSGCTRCPHAWESVWQSIQTITQHIIAGDSWGNVSIPIIDHSPATIMFFMGVLISINLLILNLILTVIVERANEEHEGDLDVIEKIKDKEAEVAKAVLMKLNRSVDADSDGIVSSDELLRAFDEQEEFAQQIRVLGVTRSELATFFDIMDVAGNGAVLFKDFVESLYRMKSHDPLQSTITIVRQLQGIKTQIQSLAEEHHSCQMGTDSANGTLNYVPESVKNTEPRWMAELRRLAQRDAEQHTMLLNSLQASFDYMTDILSVELSKQDKDRSLSSIMSRVKHPASHPKCRLNQQQGVMEDSGLSIFGSRNSSRVRPPHLANVKPNCCAQNVEADDDSIVIDRPTENCEVDP